MFLGKVLLVSSWIAMGWISLSAVSKLVDLPSFLATLAKWSAIPPWLAICGVLLVPAAEAVSAALFFASQATRRKGALVACGAVVVSQVTLIYQFSHSAVPDCGCLGVLSQYTSFTNEFPVVVAKGVVVLGALVGSLLLNVGHARTKSIR